jgi:hypothetical protein
MSDIFFTNSSEAPVPADEVRVRQFSALPRRDGSRIDVKTELTPFQKRPNIEVSIKNSEGAEVAALSVVEAIDPKMDFTMHLREADTSGKYSATITVFYADVEASAKTGQTSSGEMLKKVRQVVDQRDASFEIPEH